MASYASNPSVFRNFVKNKMGSVSEKRSKAPSNHFELAVEIIEVVIKPPKVVNTGGDGVPSGLQNGGNIGNGTPGGVGGEDPNKDQKCTITARVGRLNKEDTVKGKNGQLVRKFAIKHAKNITPQNLATIPEAKKFELLTEIEISEGDELKFDVLKSVYDRIGALAAGDLAIIHGISFSYWYSKNVFAVLKFCNVDTMFTAPTLRRDAFAHDIVMAARLPVKEMRSEGAEAASAAANGLAPVVAASDQQKKEDKFAKRLGTDTYVMQALTPEDEAEYLKRYEGSLFQLDFEERMEIVDEKEKKIVSFRPDIYQGSAALGAKPQNGFKTIAKGSQWNGSEFEDAQQNGTVRSILSWLRLDSEDVSIYRVIGDESWKQTAKALLTNSSMSIIVKENLEQTGREMTSGGGGEDPMDIEEPGDDEDAVDLKLVASVRGFQTNVRKTIMRAGVPLPHDRVLEYFGKSKDSKEDQKLESPLHGYNYHARAGRNLILNLNEYNGSLSQLLKEDRYDYYIIHGADLEADDFEILHQLPEDKRWLPFYREFLASVKKASNDEKRKAVAKEFGISVDNVLTLLPIIGKTEKPQKNVYAILKQSLLNTEFLDNDIFRKVVTGFVQGDAEAFIAKLKGAAGIAVAAGNGSAHAAAAPKSPAKETKKRSREDESEKPTDGSVSSVAAPAAAAVAAVEEPPKKKARKDDTEVKAKKGGKKEKKKKESKKDKKPVKGGKKKKQKGRPIPESSSEEEEEEEESEESGSSDEEDADGDAVMKD